MLTFLSLVGAVALVSPAPAPLSTLPTPALGVDMGSPDVTAANPRAAKVILLWLKTYRKGKWDLGREPAMRRRARRGRGAQTPDNDNFLITKHKLLPDSFRGQLDYGKEIDLLCHLAKQTETVDAARAILQVAAVGLDSRVRYTNQMTPADVRRTGEAHLRTMRSTLVRQYLAEAATGSPGGSSKFKTAMQAAALRALGAQKSSVHRKHMVDQLQANAPMVRAAAAHALGRLAEVPAVAPLAQRIAREGDDLVLIEILTAIDMICSVTGVKNVKLAHMQMATLEAGRALGRLDSWRPDIAILDFLAKYRSKNTVPALIKILERYAAEPQNIRSGRLSGRLRVRTHEVLAALTGARIPADQPAAWRNFWETNKDKFELAKLKPQDKKPSGTKGGGFFDIPVQGKRVVFVIDISGSMQQPMRARGNGRTVAGGAGASARKIAILKRELWKAIKALPSDTKFNVVYYNHKTDQWSKKLVAASNPTKRRFKSWLDQQKAEGGTNIFDAMKLALKIKSLVYGQHYDSNVDELFLLSDGVPTAGEITDPNAILRTITETNKFSRVKINTVYLEGRNGGRRPGGGRGVSGSQLMKLIAKQNGGKCVIP